MSRIATSAFAGSPLDKLASADTYGIVDSNLRTEYQSTFTAFTQNLLDQLGRQNRLLRDIADAVTQNGGFDPKLAKDRINRVLSSSRTQVDKLSDDLQTQILENLGYDSQTAKQIKVQVNDKIRQLESGSYHDVAGMVGILNDVTGQAGLFKMIDEEANLGLLQGALDEIVNWGIPDAIDAVMENVEDNATKRKLASRLSAQLANAGNIDNVESMLKHTDANALLARMPDFPKRLLQQYRLDEVVTPDQYPDKLQQLVGVLDKLQPDWFQTYRGDHVIVNFAYLAYASDDALILFKTSEVYRTAALAAPNYPERSLPSILKSMYPYIPIVA